MVSNRLKKNSRRNVINTLNYFSSFEEQRAYQISVSFVPVIAELLQQWESSFLLKKDKQWFIKLFSREEWEMLHEFNRVIINNSKTLNRLSNRTIEEYEQSITGKIVKEKALSCLKIFPREEIM